MVKKTLSLIFKNHKKAKEAKEKLTTAVLIPCRSEGLDCWCVELDVYHAYGLKNLIVVIKKGKRGSEEVEIDGYWKWSF